MADLRLFEELVRKNIALAEQKFGFKPRFPVEIKFNSRGRIAGKARRTRIGGINFYSLFFNREAIEKHWDDMVKETIPHEVAHLVCYMFKNLGNDHDAGWQRVCKALGGVTSDRCHNYQLTPSKNSAAVRGRRRYYYNVSGQRVELNIKQHNIVQDKGRNAGKGRLLRFRGEVIKPEMFVEEKVYGGSKG